MYAAVDHDLRREHALEALRPFLLANAAHEHTRGKVRDFFRLIEFI